MTISSFEFKRGATFEAEITLTDDLDVPVEIDPAHMTAQIRDGSALLADLDITTSTPGVYLLTTADDTSDWALGVALLDIRAETGGKIFYSETVGFSIVRQITLVAAP